MSLPATLLSVALALLVATISSACLTQYGATGIVISATGPDVASVTDFTLRTYDGQTLQFKVGVLDVNNGLPAPHLREHLVSGLPILVTYHVDNGVNVATRYIDTIAPSAAPTQLSVLRSSR